MRDRFGRAQLHLPRNSGIVRGEVKKESLSAFNDGVIAIIVTLMVLDIHLPKLDAAGVRSLSMHIGIYAISFVIAAIFWQNLHALLDELPCISRLAVWLDLLVLFFMSLIPLPTEALGEHPTAVSSNVFFGLVMTLGALAYALLHKSVEADLPIKSTEARRYLHLKNCAAVILLALSIPLARLSTWISLPVFVIVPLLYFIPSRHLHAAER